MDYSSEVRRRFLAPARAGAIPARAPGVLEGAAEDRSLGMWVRFQVQIQGATIERVRFQAYGCPHTVAAADSVASELEGKPVHALASLNLEEIARRLRLPREKFGKLLRIEDALTACHARVVTKDERVESNGNFTDRERR